MLSRIPTRLIIAGVLAIGASVLLVQTPAVTVLSEILLGVRDRAPAWELLERYANVAAGVTLQQEAELQLEEDGLQCLVAIGDLHGDLEQGQKALQLAGVADDQGRWTGGKCQLVQTGDIIDRAAQSIPLALLFAQLQGDAASAGGRVHVLLGNHELMNLMGDYRYISNAELLRLGQQKLPESKSPPALRYAGLQEWQRQLQPDQAFGKLLRTMKLFTIAGSGFCRSLFVHAGVNTKMVNAASKAQGSKGPMDIMQDHLQDLLQHGQNLPSQVDAVQVAGAAVLQPSSSDWHWLLYEHGPVWYRGLFTMPEAKLCPALRKVLRRLNVHRVVAGHNIMVGGKLKTRCDGAIHLIDIGMSRFYQGELGTWSCSGDAVVANYPNNITVVLEKR